jgi:hypothetical protein
MIKLIFREWFVSVLKHYGMKTYREIEVQFDAMLPSVIKLWAQAVLFSDTKLHRYFLATRLESRQSGRGPTFLSRTWLQFRRSGERYTPTFRNNESISGAEIWLWLGTRPTNNVPRISCNWYVWSICIAFWRTHTCRYDVFSRFSLFLQHFAGVDLREISHKQDSLSILTNYFNQIYVYILRFYV